MTGGASHPGIRRGRRRSPTEWRRVVLASPRITDSTRVLLLELAEHMEPDLTVSMPRVELAAALNRSERRIAERIAAAHEAGFLDTVSPGYRGHTAVYIATFPDSERVTQPSTRSDSERVTKANTQRGAHGGHPLRPQSVTPGGHTTYNAPPCHACGESAAYCTCPPDDLHQEHTA